MRAVDIYQRIAEYSDSTEVVICNLHSACSPLKGKKYICDPRGSNHPVIDFDSVERKRDKELGIESRKSVDAMALSSSKVYICFIELKSWRLVLENNPTENKINKKKKKYSSDLPLKLTESIAICKEITNDNGAFDGCNILYILSTDISTSQSGLNLLHQLLTSLSGTTSNLIATCNKISKDIMDNISGVETMYIECRDLDKVLSNQ